MDVVQVGVDHHRAPLDVRERMAVGGDRMPALLAALASEPWLSEVLVVSTCNRTEAYAVSADPDAPSLLVAALRRSVSDAPAEDDAAWVRRTGEAAALHLFRVAAGLDSALIGETEIQGQVKEAHRLALEARTAGAVLDRLASLALKAGKRARTDTALCRGAVSHGQAAYEVTRRVFGDLARRTVLVVGAGEMATRAATAVAALPGGRFVVANRTLEAAEALARTLPEGRAVPLASATEHVPGAHVAIFAGGGEPMTRAVLEPLIARRRDPLLLLDFCVPRAVEATVADLPGVFVYDLEAVERILAKSLASRHEAVPAVETILSEEFAAFRAWQRTRRVVPAIRSLQAWAEDIRRAELGHLPADVPAALREHVDTLTRRIVEKILRRPTARVRQGAEAQDPAMPTPDHLRAVFGLDEADAGDPRSPTRARPDREPPEDD
ncbi:MAG: glutamyl-tRNA reductase [Planctomycetes bacterium]|nr:glutamyl-tRNA reductase [Planctomycetota bacterium]